MSAPAFRDFALLALDLREEQGIRGIGTERNRFLNHICFAAFAKKPIDEVRPVDIRDWLRSTQKKAADTRGDRLITTDTVKRAYSLVSAIFTCAVERDVIEVSPCANVRVKKRADEHSTTDKWTWLTLPEQKALASCQAIPFMDRLMIRFAIGTGLRQGEQCNLELADLHLEGLQPYVYVRYGSPNHLPPKNGKPRRVPLMKDAHDAAQQWLYELPTYAPSNPGKLVFPTTRGRIRPVGKPLGGGGKLKAHLAHVGITRRVRWHDCRHSFCSSLVSGVWGRRWSLEEIRPIAGHSSILITQRYAHIGEEDLMKAAGETRFAHGPMMPLAQAQPIDADDFAAVDWDEAVSA